MRWPAGAGDHEVERSKLGTGCKIDLAGRHGSHPGCRILPGFFGTGVGRPTRQFVGKLRCRRQVVIGNDHVHAEIHQGFRTPCPGHTGASYEHAVEFNIHKRYHLSVLSGQNEQVSIIR